MKWISFSWTTPAVVARQKTVTRRDYGQHYAERFRAGQKVMAVDTQPRYGGKPIAVIRLVQDCAIEPDAQAPDSDYEAEGFDFLRQLAREDPERLPKKVLRDLQVGMWGRDVFHRWRHAGGSSAVLRFEVLDVLVPLERMRFGRVQP